MIYLDPEQHRALRAQAGTHGMSMAELVRRLVAEYFDKLDAHARSPQPQAIFTFVALGKSSRLNTSALHDRLAGAALEADDAHPR